jgi:RHS repeat-associated protein
MVINPNPMEDVMKKAMVLLCLAVALIASTQELYAGRYFVPEMARWTTPDPALRDKLPKDLVKIQDGKLLSTSPYGYAYDNPLRYTDPDGKTPWDIVDIAAAALSIKDFIEKPTLTNAVLAAVDVIGAAVPVVPSVGTFRHGARLLGKVDDVVGAFKTADKATDLLKTAENTWGGLKDAQKLNVDEALQKAIDYLGEGYKDMGNGRFVSADGLRQVRMGDADILGKHGGGSHMNFEKLAPNPQKPDKMQVVENKHIYLEGN